MACLSLSYNFAMIEFSGVSFVSGGRTLLENFSWQLPDPGIYLLLGGNGSGKTLLSSLLAGRAVSSAGSISIMGEDSRQAAGHIWLADAATAIQDDESVEEYVEYELSCSGAAGEVMDACFALLDDSDYHTGDRLLSRLPHHEFLLIQVALACVMETPLCILDGHLTYFDAHSCRRATQMMQRISSRQERFLLLTSARVAAELPQLSGSWLLSRDHPHSLQSVTDLAEIDTGMQHLGSSTSICVYFRDAAHSPYELTSGDSYRVLSRLEGGLKLELAATLDECLRELASRGFDIKRIDLQQP